MTAPVPDGLPPSALDVAVHAQLHGDRPFAESILESLGVPADMPAGDVAAAMHLAVAIPPALTARLILAATSVLDEAGPHRSRALDGLAMAFAAIDVARVAGVIAELHPGFVDDIGAATPETETSAKVLAFPTRTAWPYGGDR